MPLAKTHRRAGAGWNGVHGHPRRRRDLSASPGLVHVQCRALVSDPVGTVAQIYDAFGVEFSREAPAAIATKVAQAPNGVTASIVTNLKNWD